MASLEVPDSVVRSHFQLTPVTSVRCAPVRRIKAAVRVRNARGQPSPDHRLLVPQTLPFHLHPTLVTFTVRSSSVVFLPTPSFATIVTSYMLSFRLLPPSVGASKSGAETNDSVPEFSAASEAASVAAAPTNGPIQS